MQRAGGDDAEPAGLEVLDGLRELGRVFMTNGPYARDRLTGSAGRRG